MESKAKRRSSVGQVLERGKGRYLIRFTWGKKPDGSRRQYSETVHGTRKRANDRLLELVAEAKNRGTMPVSRRVPLDEILGSYFEQYAARASARSWATEADQLKRMIPDTLLDTPSDRLSPEVVQDWMNGLSSSYAPSTRRMAFVHLKAAFRHAVEVMRVVESNPMSALKAPRVEPRAVTIPPSDFKALLNAALADPRYLPIAFALDSGCRWCEIRALERRHVITKGERITVRVEQSLTDNRKGGGYTVSGYPKTKASRRSIALSAPVSQAVVAHLRSHDHSWVFPSTTGTPLSLSNVTSRAWRPLLCSVGVDQHLHLRDTRHLSAGFLVGSGTPIKVVQARLGHASAALTLDVYSHLAPELQDRAVEAMESTLD